MLRPKLNPKMANMTALETSHTPLVVSLGMIVIDEIRFANGTVLTDVPGGSAAYCKSVNLYLQIVKVGIIFPMLTLRL